MQIRTLSRCSATLTTRACSGRPHTVLIPGALGTAAAPSQRRHRACPWMDTRKTPEQRAHELITAMTLDQKIHDGPRSTAVDAPLRHRRPRRRRRRSCASPTSYLSDAGPGVGGEQQIDTTTFPSAIAQAATLGPGAGARASAQRVGEEAWHKGINVMLGAGR